MKHAMGLMAFALLLGGMAFARDVEISVSDGDLGLPLEGARIEATDGRVFETDASGSVSIQVGEASSLVIRVTSPGYRPQRLVIGTATRRLEAKMLLEGVIESSELVIEARKPGVSDQKLGVSTTVTSQEMKTTANLGLVEDVMSTIKVLPGVGYAGGWDALPSIRGGEPLELSAVLDGYLVELPFHWGGAFSIFNPNMVESAKLSNGVFPAKYGHATSGLLEVTSKTPDPDHLKVELGVTTSALESIVSIPLAGKGGLIFGGKLTYWDPFVYVAGLFVPSVADTIKVAPYIRDAYIKGDYRLNPGLELFVNGFFGSDGIATKSEIVVDDPHFESKNDFSWSNYFAFGTAGLKWNPDDFLFAQFMVGGGWNGSEFEFNSQAVGDKRYTDAFRAAYPGLGLAPGSFFTLDIASSSKSGKNDFGLQSRLDVDLHPVDWLVFSIGANEMIQFFSSKQDFSGWVTDIDTLSLQQKTGSINAEGNKVFNTGAYMQAAMKSDDQFLSLDLGCRVDHLLLSGNDGFLLQTLPVLNPRANFTLTPVRNSDGIARLSCTLGSGFFSRPPVETSLIDKKFNLKDFEVKPNHVWTSVAGSELVFGDGYKISLEGYYKQVFDRFYYHQAVNAGEIEIKPHFDGVAEIWGIDLMLQKMESRYVDGWITASYSHARYRNPTADANDLDTASTTDWYWPYFHRFFNANLILNIKPVTGFTITTKLAFATGKPKSELGSPTSYPISYGSQTIEYWNREATYSDTERTDFSIPLDVRLAWNWYDTGSRVRTEFYIGAENVLVNLYSPKGNTGIDPYTGKELPDSNNADFSIGFPMISVGTKWSY